MDEKEYPAAGEQKSAAEIMKEEYLRSKERTEQLLREYEEQKRKEELAKIVQVPHMSNQPEQDAKKSRKPGKKKWLLALPLVVLLLGCILIPVLSSLNRWETKNGHTYYVVDGENATGWWDIGNDRYYFGKNGIMRTGWQKINGASYYFGSDGVMRTGWQTIDNNRYFFNTNGKMCTGWWDIGSGRYYFGNNGNMYTGQRIINGKTYYFDSDGKLLN